MRKFRFTILTLAVMAFSLMAFSSAQAQSRTWVSGVGDDLNPCSRTAPCKTFSGAISKTATNGEINCLDPGAFGTVTITKSIQIDCHEVFAGILNSATNGVSIAFDSFAGTDVRKSVRLRNLNFSGFDTGTRGISITGGAAVTGTEVFVEDCRIDGNFGSPGNGIRDARSGGGLLMVNNTTIRNMLGAGIGTAPANGSANLKVVLSNVRVSNCANGVAVSTNSKVTIYDSVFNQNSGAGVFAEDLDAGGQTEIAVDNCAVSDNGTGFQSSTNSTIRVSNTTAMYNTALFSGTVLSYGNNQAAGAAFGGPVGPS
ncbi:MAG TPA: right-handed parallel beta-helix repeat-containing protein [Pyrinomonadaceae bacterium]|nr:right-handed parallel beta-helix repeat-containing protein [Pyrinomonadaceae bacterium]